MRKLNVIKKLTAILTMITVMATLLVPPSSTSAAENYNYAEALQKAIMFYEFQMAGKLPDWIRNNWRGDSVLSDGKEVGADLTMGWFDAGDHVKFNLPMSYTVAMLSWAIYEYKDAFVKTGQLDYLLREMKWATDYFINCHPEPNVYYFEVGHGGGGYDHRYWGAAETVEQACKDLKLERITYKADLKNTATTCVASTSAAMAAASIVFAESDPDYSKLLLKHAKELYEFADKTKSTDMLKAESAYSPIADNFYKSWSGCYDQLSWACIWLHLATKDASYIDKAESYVSNWVKTQDGMLEYKWGHNWDNVQYGSQLLLARLTGKSIYIESTERNLDWWTVGYNGTRITYTPKGLAWLDSWGCLRYSSTAAFLASVYADWAQCPPEKARIYTDFAKSQIDYILGSTGRSYVIGFGKDFPKHPHHRTAQGSYIDDNKIPNYSRHTLVGALVGGPDAKDVYKDEVGEFQCSEVACDYNAGFVGILAKMYQEYGGTIIPDLNAIETPEEEYLVDAAVSSTGDNFVSIKAILRNRSGWPAKVCYNMSFKYFMDLSELVSQGVDPSSLTTNLIYHEGAKISEVLPWDKDNNIYYVNIEFPNSAVYPGGQTAHRREAQFTISAPNGTKGWDNKNDFSFKGLPTSGNDLVKAENIPVYDEGVYLAGNIPGGVSPTPPSIKPSPSPSPSSAGATVSGYIDADLTYSPRAAAAVKSGFKVELVGTGILTETDENGYFVLNNVPISAAGSSYSIKITKNSFLQRTIEGIRVPKDGIALSTQTSPLMLWSGDIEVDGVQDGAINIKDIMEVAKSFNTAVGNSKYNINSDLNYDDAVNISDIMIITRHFNVVSTSYPVVF